MFASPGFGATQHLAAELFKQVAGRRHAACALPAARRKRWRGLLSKNTDVLFDTMTALLGQVQSGQVRALAITGKDRDPAAPDIPPVIESGVVPNYDVTTWVWPVRPQGHAAGGDHQAQQGAERNPDCGAGDPDRLHKTGVIVKSSTPEAWGTSS